MSRIDEVLRQLKNEKRKAFVAYITAGDPDLDHTETFCQVLAENGVDIIELGIPFSDPLADGPTNQLAAERALASGTTLDRVLTKVELMRKKGIEIPIVLFSYLNPIFQMGYDVFAKRCKSVGVDGALVLDLPPEEAREYIEIMRSQEVDTVFLASPTTTKDRLESINRETRGFLYYVSRTGVTGQRQDVSETLEEEIRSLEKQIDAPIIVGFGISNSEQAKKVGSLADGIVIGSAIVKILEKHHNDRDTINKLSEFISGISTTIKGC